MQRSSSLGLGTEDGRASDSDFSFCCTRPVTMMQHLMPSSILSILCPRVRRVASDLYNSQAAEPKDAEYKKHLSSRAARDRDIFAEK